MGSNYIPFIQNELGGTEKDIGYWRISISVAFLFSNLFMQIKFMEKFHNIKMSIIFIAFAALSFCLMYYVYSLYMFLIVILLNCFCHNIARNSLSSESIKSSPNHLIGRVSGVRLFIANIAWLVGHLINYWTIRLSETGRINFIFAGLIYFLVLIIIIPFYKKLINDNINYHD